MNYQKKSKEVMGMKYLTRNGNGRLFFKFNLIFSCKFIRIGIDLCIAQMRTRAKNNPVS